VQNKREPDLIVANVASIPMDQGGVRVRGGLGIDRAIRSCQAAMASNV
jgi:hypothetical protein